MKYNLLIHILFLTFTLFFAEESQTICAQNTDKPVSEEEKYRQYLIWGDHCVSAGQFKDALKCYQTVIDFYREAGRDNSVASAAVHRRNGVVFSMLNDAEPALESFSTAESVLINYPDNPEYPKMLCDRAALYRNMSEYRLAIEDLNKAYNLYRKTLGKNHILTLLAKTDLLRCRKESGEDEVANPIDVVWKVNPKQSAEMPMEYLRYLEVLTELYFENRFYEYSIDFANYAIDLCQTIQDDDSFALMKPLHLLGESLLMMGNPEKAMETYQKMFTLERRFVREVFTFLPESSRAAYWSSCDSQMNGLFELNRQRKIFDIPGIAELLYDAALFHKGLLLEATSGIAEIVAESGDNGLQKDFQHLQDLRRQQVADNSSDPDHSKLLTADIKETERKVMEKIKDYGDFLQYTEIKWQDVRDALKENEAAIEFVTSGSPRHGTVYYSAELIRHDSKAPEHIFMFALSPEEQGRWQGHNVYENPILGHKIWSVLLPHLKGCEHIWFAASGDLHNTAIEYLMIDNDSRINDMFSLGRLSSTRQIVVKSRSELSKEAALYGGLNYNTEPEYMEYYAMAHNEMNPRSDAVRSRALGNEKYQPWSYLKGTRDEVNEISSILSDSDFKVETYIGDTGIEESFKCLSGKKKQIIHIATHGFYIPDNEIKNVLVTEDKALISSGLVFSGANRAWLGRKVEGVDDGILTAKEISLMDLRQTDLVILSACQTGLGYISGDGVFGLQRGFKKAGAETLLMSLWEVDDMATRMLITEFYRNLLSGKNKYDSLHNAQESLKKSTFYINGVMRSGSEPYFWASFTLLD